MPSTMKALSLQNLKDAFRPFDLDDLETKIGRLSKRAGDEEDDAEQEITPRLRLRDPRTLNMDEYEGMGFQVNNYSPILPINRESPKTATPRPTSTPKLDDLILNRSDPTDNRGKIKRINSFEIAQERAASSLKISKARSSQKCRSKNSTWTEHQQSSRATQTTIELHSMWETGSPEKGLP